MGALDVCPFIPLMNTTTEDCIACSKRLGEALADELGVPVFLYEYAATAPHRKLLADIRKGEYEGLKEKVRWFTATRCWFASGMPAFLLWFGHTCYNFSSDLLPCSMYNTLNIISSNLDFFYCCFKS